MCKAPSPRPRLSKQTLRRLDSGLSRKRPYSSYPTELTQFWVDGKPHMFKKDNLRQSLARAVQTLKLAAKGEQKSVHKHGRLQPDQYENDTVKMEVKLILDMHTEIDDFAFPRTCLRSETRRPAKYRSKFRSFNTSKWLEFRSTAGMPLLLDLVLDLIFQDWDMDRLCKVWEMNCCPEGQHELECKVKWNGLLEYCRNDCGLEDCETTETEEPWGPFDVLV